MPNASTFLFSAVIPAVKALFHVVMCDLVVPERTLGQGMPCLAAEEMFVMRLLGLLKRSGSSSLVICEVIVY